MRLSTIFELLLIFLLIAFAAYGKVIDHKVYAIDKKHSSISNSTPISLKQATEDVNKYCTCNENICNCCRNFHIPLVQLSGPGCASLQYLQDDKLAMQLSIGDNILTTNIINGKNPKPVCVALPGGYSKFCGKIYSIKRDADRHFKACLGLELRSAAELEASLRVSCFRFGPDGLKLRPAEPLPASFIEPTPADDDYDDLFGLADDDDDEEEDTDYEKVSPDDNVVSDPTVNEEEQEQEQEQEEEDDDDLLGLGALLDIFTDDDDSTTNKKTKVSTTPLPPAFTIPILSLQTTSVHSLTESAVSRDPASNLATDEPIVSSTTGSFPLPLSVSTSNIDNKKNSSEIYETDDLSTGTTDYLLDTPTKIIIDKNINYITTPTIDVDINESNNIPIKNSTNKIDKIKHKKIQISNKKKLNVTQSVNSINNNPIKIQDSHQNVNSNDDLENEYDYDISQDDEENEEFDDSNEKITSVEQDEQDEDEKDENDEDDKQVDSSEVSLADGVDYDDDDDSEEEIEEDEEAVIDALVDNEQTKNNNNTNKNKKKNKITDSKTTDAPEYESDYGLTDLLSRKHPAIRTLNNQKIARSIGRQSKVMRL